MIVVTGGAGFIGSCFIRKLNDEGIRDILVVDTLGRTMKWKNLVGKQFLDIVHKTTFRQSLLAGEYGAEIESIIHLGACSATTEQDADYLLSNNYEYSKDLALYAEARNIRFLYASSAATYGAGAHGYDDGIFHLLQPLNMYGYSKHLFDLWVLRNNLDKKFVGIKFFNVFGPNEYHKGDMASVIFKSYHQVLQTGTIRLFKSYKAEYADGEQKRDFIYVKDIVGTLYQMMRYGEITGIFNLGTGHARTWNDVIHALFAALGRTPSIEYIDMPESLKNQYQYFTEATMAKLQQTRIYEPCRILEETVRDYVQEHLAKGIAHY